MKKCLFLGYRNHKTSLISEIKKNGWLVNQWGNKKPNKCFCKYDLIISFGYRHIINKKIIENCKRPIINLHISYLPYNRGSHPNFWSFINNTPKGISIHEVSDGIDTGNVIFRKKIKFKDNIDNFRITHKILIEEIEKLFIKKINLILKKKYRILKIEDICSIHYKKELPSFVKNWDISISKAKKLLKESI